MTNVPRVLPDLHGWAGKHLGTPPTASADEARTALLRQLADCDWLPSSAMEESQAYFAQPPKDKLPSALSEQAVLDEEGRLRNEVEAFAEAYFDLDPRQRQKRYQELAAQCGWSVTVSARLQLLAAALKLPRTPWKSAPDDHEELVEHVCGLFALSPAERARRRWELVQEMESAQGRANNWAAIARAVRNADPTIASLEPVLIQELASGNLSRKWKPGRLPKVTQPAPAQPARTGGYGWALAALMVVFGLIRACGVDRPAQPRFNQPDFQKPFPLEDFRKQRP